MSVLRSWLTMPTKHGALRGEVIVFELLAVTAGCLVSLLILAARALS